MGSTQRDLYLDIPLSKVAIAYRPMNFIADLIAPVVPVPKQSGAYTIWNIGDAFRVEDTKRAPATRPHKVTRSISSGTYYANNYALADRIPYEDIKNAEAGAIITERRSRVEFLKDKLMLDMEQRVANLVTSGSNVGSYSACASAWTDSTAGNSDPISDINTAINNVLDLTGYRPNRMIMGEKAWRNFREHADVIARIYGSAGRGTPARLITPELTKALFEVDDVLIGRAFYNTTMEGQSESLSLLWGDHVLVYYAPSAPRRDAPSFMYSFRWKNVMNMQTEIYQDKPAKAEEIQLGYYQDEKVTAANLGFLFTNVTSST